MALLARTERAMSASRAAGLVLGFAGALVIFARADALSSVAVLGLLGTGIAYILNDRLLADDGPTVASTVTYLTPMVAILLGAAVLGETVSLRVVAGMIVVLAGVGLVRRAARSPDPAAAPAKPMGAQPSAP